MPLPLNCTCIVHIITFGFLVQLLSVCLCVCVCAVDGDVNMDNADDEQNYSFTEYFQ